MITRIQNNGVNFSANIHLAQSLKKLGHALGDSKFKNQVASCTKFDTFNVTKGKGEELVIEAIRAGKKISKNTCAAEDLKRAIQKLI